MAIFRVDVPEEIVQVFEKYDRSLMRKVFFKQLLSKVVENTSGVEIEKRVVRITLGEFGLSFNGSNGNKDSLSDLQKITEDF